LPILAATARWSPHPFSFVRDVCWKIECPRGPGAAARPDGPRILATSYPHVRVDALDLARCPPSGDARSCRRSSV